MGGWVCRWVIPGSGYNDCSDCEGAPFSALPPTRMGDTHPPASGVGLSGLCGVDYPKGGGGRRQNSYCTPYDICVSYTVSMENSFILPHLPPKG